MTDHALGVGHRLDAGPSDLLATTAFAHELEAAPYLWRGLAMADLAHAIALDDAGLLPADVCGELIAALLRTTEIPWESADLDPAVGDVYNNRDRLLRELSPRTAGFIHAGRARREAATIAWLLICRDRLLDLGVATCRLADVMATMSGREAATLMPDYTYLHRAQPTTLGHYLLGHAEPIVRHLGRIDTALRAIDASPAGSGSTNGSRLPIRRELLAELLGFGGVMRHTRDSMWAPDIVLDIVGACVQTMTSIDRLAEELQLWTTEAFGFVEIADDVSRTSVVMPHKKNPYALTYLRGASRHSLGVSTGINATMMTASGQPDNRTFAYLEVPKLIGDTTAAADLLRSVLEGAAFDARAMRAAASSGFLTSTEICDYLALHHGLDNRTAHSLVGGAVRLAVADGRSHIVRDDIVVEADRVGLELPLDDATLVELLDPDETIASRVTFGGAGRNEVLSMASAAERSVQGWRAHFDEHPSRGYDTRLIARAVELMNDDGERRKDPDAP